MGKFISIETRRMKAIDLRSSLPQEVVGLKSKIRLFRKREFLELGNPGHISHEAAAAEKFSKCG